MSGSLGLQNSDLKYEEQVLPHRWNLSLYTWLLGQTTLILQSCSPQSHAPLVQVLERNTVISIYGTAPRYGELCFYVITFSQDSR